MRIKNCLLYITREILSQVQHRAKGGKKMALIMKPSPLLPTDCWLKCRLESIEGLDGSLVTERGKEFCFNFMLLDKDIRGHYVSITCPAHLTPGSPLHRILCGFGLHPQEGERAWPESIVGQTCQIRLATRSDISGQKLDAIRPWPPKKTPKEIPLEEQLLSLIKDFSKPLKPPERR